MAATVKFDGVKEMQSKIRQVVRDLPDRVAKALFAEAQIEMTESKRRVPVDTGVLRASGTVHPPDREGTKISVILSYGGAAETYAREVHENLEAFHKIGQAKYLQSVIDESRSHMLARLAARLKL